MAIKLPSHLHRSRHGTLHFRIAVPSDLRQHFVFKEFYTTLGINASDAAFNEEIIEEGIIETDT